MVIEVKISGRVQGVWFRAWTREQAMSLGLKGWVRNCIDGSVEARFEGSDETVTEMLRRCHDGPDSALVERVERKESAACEACIGFEIR